MHGVDADPHAIDANHLPGVGQLAIQISAARDQYGAAGVFAAEHAAGVGAVDGDDFAVGEADVGEKPFVALNERAANKLRWKKHLQSYSERGARFPTIRKKDFSFRSK